MSIALIAYGSSLFSQLRIHDGFKYEYIAPTMSQAAVQGGLTKRILELLHDNTSSLPQDTPESLVAFARKHGKHEEASVIQSFIASQSIEKMLREARQAQTPEITSGPQEDPKPKQSSAKRIFFKRRAPS